MDKRNFEGVPPNELAASCREHASKWKVSAAVHPQDFIFHFLLKHPAFSEKDDAVRQYFDDGRRSSELLKSILENELSVNIIEQQKMLEFASGYGMITRHLPAVFPAFDITSSDIHPDANNFIIKELGGKAIQSSSVPENFDAADEYDLVFALSFFSHMPATTWSRWLLALFKTLSIGGNLIFTTHGPTSLRKMQMDVSLDEEGFSFRPDSEQDDLDKMEYGTTFASSCFVVKQIEALEDCEVRLVRAGLWWGHQDLYVASKIAKATSSPAPYLDPRDEIAQLKQKIQELESRFSQSQTQLGKLQAALIERNRDCERLKQQIDSTHASMCWRLTWPIRWLHKLFSRTSAPLS
jgi:hypothetical protein